MPPQDSLEGKVAIVTGASSGIGKATIQTLARKGTNVVAAARSKQKIQSIIEEINDETVSSGMAVPTDITKEEDVVDLFKQTINEYDRIDIVVSNAGIGKSVSTTSLSKEEFDEMRNVNIDGTFLVAKQALPYLRESEGNLIFTGSFAGKYHYGGSPPYSASKWWLRGFAASLAAESQNQKVAITVVNPSTVRSNFSFGKEKSNRDLYEGGDITEPQDVSEVITFAASQSPPNAIFEMDFYRRDKFINPTVSYEK